MIGSGLVLVDKPDGWTSHDVVARVRRLAGTRKVGHAGTLDPMATGLLILGLNSSTRLLTYIVGADKEYLATIRLGASTTTDDAEGETTSTAPQGALDAVTDEAIAAGIATLTGEIEQVPSAVSAIKVDGKRAYARVRAGEDVVLEARPVTVSRFDVLGARPGTTADGVAVLDVDVAVVVSSGTYVRALARDLGAALGTGGHLTALRRTRVGGYDLAGASTLEELEAQADADGVLATLPLADAARATFPVRELSADEARALGYGQWVPASGERGTVAAVGPDGALVALLEDTRRRGEALAKPVLVLAPAGG
jgi:tRNA pseudouridine55 synthase